MVGTQPARKVQAAVERSLENDELIALRAKVAFLTTELRKKDRLLQVQAKELLTAKQTSNDFCRNCNQLITSKPAIL